MSFSRLYVCMNSNKSHFSPLWKRRCFLSFDGWLNDLSQVPNFYAFSPLCRRVCVFRF